MTVTCDISRNVWMRHFNVKIFSLCLAFCDSCSLMDAVEWGVWLRRLAIMDAINVLNFNCLTDSLPTDRCTNSADRVYWTHGSMYSSLKVVSPQGLLWHTRSSCTGSATSSLIPLPNNCVSVGLPVSGCISGVWLCVCVFGGGVRG